MPMSRVLCKNKDNKNLESISQSSISETKKFQNPPTKYIVKILQLWGRSLPFQLFSESSVSSPNKIQINGKEK